MDPGAGVDSGGIPRFSFGPGSGPGVKIFVKHRTRIRSHFSFWEVAGVCICVVISEVKTWVNFALDSW